MPAPRPAPTAGPARFTMTAYTGEPMLIAGWDTPVVVDLQTADLSGTPFPALYDHAADLRSVVGVVERLFVRTRRLVAAGRFTPGGGNMAAEVLGLARQGYAWQASVGCNPGRVDRVKAGAVGVANWGREYPGPVLIGRRAVFREVSFVVLAGDWRTSVVLARRPPGKRPAVKPTFDEWLTLFGFRNPAALTRVQLVNLKLLFAEQYPARPDRRPAGAPLSLSEMVPAR